MDPGNATLLLYFASCYHTVIIAVAQCAKQNGSGLDRGFSCLIFVNARQPVEPVAIIKGEVSGEVLRAQRWAQQFPCSIRNLMILLNSYWQTNQASCLKPFSDLLCNQAMPISFPGSPYLARHFRPHSGGYFSCRRA